MKLRDEAKESSKTALHQEIFREADLFRAARKEAKWADIGGHTAVSLSSVGFVCLTFIVDLGAVGIPFGILCAIGFLFYGNVGWTKRCERSRQKEHNSRHVQMQLERAAERIRAFSEESKRSAYRTAAKPSSADELLHDPEAQLTLLTIRFEARVNREDYRPFVATAFITSNGPKWVLIALVVEPRDENDESPNIDLKILAEETAKTVGRPIQIRHHAFTDFNGLTHL